MRIDDLEAVNVACVYPSEANRMGISKNDNVASRKIEMEKLRDRKRGDHNLPFLSDTLEV